MNKSIVAILVTYNRKKLLRESLCQLISLQHENLDIMIVDNASTDNSKEYISDLIDRNDIIYINTGENLGGAGGFNFGIKEAYKMSYDYYWLMDDDTMVTDTALEEFLRADQVLKSKWGFLSSSVYWTNGDTCLMNKQTIHGDWVNNLNLIDNGIVKIKEATFVSCFIKKEVIEDVGLPIKEFIIWNDDREFTDRISRKYDSYLVSRSKVIHKINNNIETDIENDSYDRMWRYKYVFRNGFYFTKRKGFKAIIRYHIRVLKRIIKVLKSPCDKKIFRIYTILKSLILGYTFNPKVEYICDIK